ncbi:MAG TPA: site-2 protease family protein [Actinomycetota bacterium]|nr:site-2 protease family protein [Actinomycetota bacterium]
MSLNRSRRARPLSPGFRIARLFGIDIVIDATWLISVVLFSVVTYDLIGDEFDGSVTGLPAYVLAFLFTLPLYASIVVHEIAHSLVARAYRMPVRRIVLFLFGGVSQIEREAPSPAAEYNVALAGPLVSLLLAATFGLLARLLNPDISGFLGIFGLVATINLALAAFNLIPAFPMDGGRILRSALWRGTADRYRATRWASRIGALIAGGFVALGVGLFVNAAVGSGHHSDGLWIALLGLFLYNAAQAAGRAEGGDRPNAPPPPEF